MPVSAETLSKLMDAGLDGDALLDVVRSIDADMDSRKPRTKGAERQARYRAKKAENVTSDVTCDVTSDVTGEKEKPPHTPQKKISPPKKNPPKGGQKEIPPKPFEEVWDAWPQPGRTRSSRKQVQAAYAGVLKAYDHAEVMRAVGMYLRSPDAKKDGGQFVPALHRWLRDERFTAWLEAATPKAVEPVGPVDLPDTPEGRFLTECREDGASERDLRAWSGRFVIEEINGLSAAVTQDDDAALREVFAKTLKRHGMTAMHSLRAKRIKEKAA